MPALARQALPPHLRGDAPEPHLLEAGPVTANDLPLPWEESPDEPAAQATDPCGVCGGPLGPDWDLDRSVHRCPGLGVTSGVPDRTGLTPAQEAGTGCGFPVHEECTELRAYKLSRCPGCEGAHQLWCRVHYERATAPCPDCGGTRHVRGACSWQGGDGAWRCRAHRQARRAVTAPPWAGPQVAATYGPVDRSAATRTVPGPVAGAITSLASNQGAFVRPGTGLRDAGLFGFTFSTQSELLVAQALERRRVWWTGLVPARVNDDAGHRRTRELDFLVIAGGVPGILELDGWPHDGRAAEDHAKDRASKRAGIWVVERVPSAEALRAPDHVVERFLGMLRAYARRAA